MDNALGPCETGKGLSLGCHPPPMVGGMQGRGEPCRACRRLDKTCKRPCCQAGGLGSQQEAVGDKWGGALESPEDPERCQPLVTYDWGTAALKKY